MDERTVRHFLDHVGSHTLLGYLSQRVPGVEPTVALKERLAWAEEAQREVGHAHEALMLLEHEALFFDRLQKELTAQVIRGDDEHSTAFEPRPKTDPMARFPEQPSGLTLMEDLTPLPQSSRDIQEVMDKALAERDARRQPVITPPSPVRVFSTASEPAVPAGLRVALTVAVALAGIGLLAWLVAG